MLPPEHDDELGPLANKLRALRYLKVRRRDKQQLTIDEIAEGVSRLYAETHESDRPLLNRQYLNDLLNGRRRNPTHSVLQGLADFFGISPAYFFEGTERTPQTVALEEEVELMVAGAQLMRTMRDAGHEDAKELTLALMRGAAGLDPKTARGMLLMQVEAMKRAQDSQDS